MNAREEKLQNILEKQVPTSYNYILLDFFKFRELSHEPLLLDSPVQIEF